MRYLLILTGIVTCCAVFAQTRSSKHPDLSFIRPDSIRIIRDEWGVPHIFAPTDAEVAYGLAWAQCEDDFKTMQDFLLIIKGFSGRRTGIDGVKMDYAVGLLGAEELTRREYHAQVPEHVQKYLRAFAAGVNRWVELNPDQVLIKKAFPVTEFDLAMGYNLGMSLMSGVQGAFSKIMDNKLPKASENPPKGSNAMAVHGSKTEDGKTYIAINAHQPLEGIMSWYEAHLVSGEGMNILGGAFPGAATIGHGVNEHIAWAHTMTYPDLIDIYKLDMHPRKKNMYKLDGQWKKLESKTIPLKIRFPKSGIRLNVGKKGFYSVFGPTLKTDHGVYSFHLPTLKLLKAPEQWLNMAKAKNHAEFMKALELQSLPCFNIVYADRLDTIMYMTNPVIPQRNGAFDWKGVLPGDTSATVLDSRFLPVTELPGVVNPKSGFVYNANNSPYLCTHPDDNPKSEDYEPTMGHQSLHTNRSFRLEALFLKTMDGRKLDWQQFLDIKYDRQYPSDFHFPVSVEHVFKADPNRYPEIKDELMRLQRWNRRGDAENVEASFFMMSLYFILESIGGLEFNLDYRPEIEEKVVVSAVIKAREYLIKHFGTLEVPLGKLQRLRRGSVDLPLDGLPDMIVAMYSSPREDGTLQPRSGESYIMMVKIGPEGPEIQTVNAFGASNRPDSPHYTDQMKLFVNHQLKPMTLNKEEVLKKAVKVYSPR